MRRSLKWGNMRNPYPVLYVSQETAPPSMRVETAAALNIISFVFGVASSTTCLEGGEEGGDDVKSAWPSDVLGYTRATMAGTMGCQAVRRS